MKQTLKIKLISFEKKPPPVNPTISVNTIEIKQIEPIILNPVIFNSFHIVFYIIYFCQYIFPCSVLTPTAATIHFRHAVTSETAFSSGKIFCTANAFIRIFVSVIHVRSN